MVTVSHLVRYGRWLRRRAEDVAVALLATMFVCFVIQIVFRYLFDYPVGWTVEVSLITWLWTVLWGSAFVISEREEIRFDIVYGIVPERVRRAFTVITGAALIALYGLSLPAAWKFVAFMKVERTTYLHIPIDYMFSIFIAFSFACICRYGWLVWRALRGAKSPMTDPSSLVD